MLAYQPYWFWDDESLEMQSASLFSVYKLSPSAFAIDMISTINLRMDIIDRIAIAFFVVCPFAIFFLPFSLINPFFVQQHPLLGSSLSTPCLDLFPLSRLGVSCFLKPRCSLFFHTETYTIIAPTRLLAFVVAHTQSHKRYFWVNAFFSITHVSAACSLQQCPLRATVSSIYKSFTKAVFLFICCVMACSSQGMFPV